MKKTLTILAVLAVLSAGAIADEGALVDLYIVEQGSGESGCCRKIHFITTS